jgi:hypothetical protein
MNTAKINKAQIFIGIATLLVGVLVYLGDRPPDTAYFLAGWAKDISFHDKIPTIFGPIGKSLPSFTHVFSFILITAGILGSRKRGYLYICLFWLFVDGAFELGQRYDSIPLSFIPMWFEGIPFLENTANFFRLGTFDYLDLTSFFLGTVLAYIVLVTTMERREFHEKEERQIY